MGRILSEAEADKRIPPGFRRLVPYKGQHYKILYEHLLCGKKFQVTPHQLSYHKTGCPKCGFRWKAQAITTRLLEIYLGSPAAINVSPSWLKGKFQLDAYWPKLRLAYEYDGIWAHSSIQAKKRDVLKTQLCRANGVSLIRCSIPLKRIKQEAESYLLKQLTSVSHLPPLTGDCARPKTDVEWGEIFRAMRCPLLQYESDIEEMNDGRSTTEALRDLKERCPENRDLLRTSPAQFRNYVQRCMDVEWRLPCDALPRYHKLIEEEATRGRMSVEQFLANLKRDNPQDKYLHRVSRDVLVDYLRKKHRISWKIRKRIDIDIERAIKLEKAGLSYADIAAKVGGTAMTIRARLRELGYNRSNVKSDHSKQKCRRAWTIARKRELDARRDAKTGRISPKMP